MSGQWYWVVSAAEAFRQEDENGPFEQVPLSAVRAKFAVTDDSERGALYAWERRFRRDYSWEPHKAVNILLRVEAPEGETPRPALAGTIKLPRTVETGKPAECAERCLTCGNLTVLMLMDVGGVYANFSECCGGRTRSIPYRRVVQRMMLKHFNGDRTVTRKWFGAPNMSDMFWNSPDALIAFEGPQRIYRKLTIAMAEE